MTPDNFIPNVTDIPTEYVKGRKYHLAWAKNRGMVWKLVDYSREEDSATMVTPRTKKTLKTKLSDLRNINKYCNQ